MPGIGAITKASKEFNNLRIDSPIEGTKTAAYLNRITKEAEIELEAKKLQEHVEETPIVTVQDIEEEMNR